MILELAVRARRRLLWNDMASEAARAASVATGMLVLFLIFGTDILNWRWVLAIPGLTLAAGIVAAIRRRPDAYTAAKRIDANLKLADTLSTAIFFWPPRPPRACDEGMRIGQRENARRVASEVDLRSALPFRIPRRPCARAAAFAIVAATLLTIRYRESDRLDLRPPLPAFAQLLQQAQNMAAMIERKEEKSAKKESEANRSDESAAAAEKGEGDRASAAAEPPENSSEAEKKAGSTAGNKEQSAADRAEAENSENAQDGAEQQDGSQSASANNGGSRRQQQGPDSERQNGQSGSSSSLLSKISNSMSNLLSALKPQSGGQRSEANRNAGSGAGRPESDSASRQGAQGSASRSSAQPGDPQAASGGFSESAPKPQAKGEQQEASGAGHEEGDKTIKAAEQLEAMGKISTLLGKRSQELTGTAFVEVTSSGPQELRTAYESRDAQHADVQAKANRDEIPLAFQDFVEHYFRELRSTGGRAARTGRR